MLNRILKNFFDKIIYKEEKKVITVLRNDFNYCDRRTRLIKKEIVKKTELSKYFEGRIGLNVKGRKENKVNAVLQSQ